MEVLSFVSKLCPEGWINPTYSLYIMHKEVMRTSMLFKCQVPFLDVLC